MLVGEGAHAGACTWITPGTLVRQPAGLQDFAPTILGIAGLLKQPRPFPLDGVNLLPSIADATRLRATAYFGTNCAV